MTLLDLRPTTSAEEAPGARANPSPSAGRRSAGLLGLLGAGVLAYGVTVPWASTYGGLLSQSGLGSRNGTILLGGALVSTTLAAGLVGRASMTLRWLLALTGFLATGFAGYLLVQLYAISGPQQTTHVSKGPGLYVVTAGATLVFATIFLPMPGPVSSDETTSVTLPHCGSDSRPPSVAPRLSRWLRPARSPLRYPAALLAVVAGLAHVPVTSGHLVEAPYIGVMFIVLTVTCTLLAALVLISDSPLVWTALGLTCGLAVIAYVVSRTVGLPLMSDDIGSWFETLGVVSVATESAVAALSVTALTAARVRSPGPLRTSRPAGHAPGC